MSQNKVLFSIKLIQLITFVIMTCNDKSIDWELNVFSPLDSLTILENFKDYEKYTG